MKADKSRNDLFSLDTIRYEMTCQVFSKTIKHKHHHPEVNRCLLSILVIDAEEPVMENMPLHGETVLKTFPTVPEIICHFTIKHRKPYSEPHR